MADNRRIGGVNNNAMGGYHPPYGMAPNQYGNQPPYGNRRPPSSQEMEQQRILRERKKRALENLEYRRRIDAIDKSRGGIDRTAYKLAEDRKPKKQRDYFYVMRKGLCFLVFIFMLLTIGLSVLSYLKIEAIPQEYISLFIKTEIPEDGVATITDKYLLTDPVFGFIKNISGKFLSKEIVLGDSPLYDDMLLHSAGMSDMVSKIALEYFPAAIILYVIVVLIMLIKSFLAIFGRRTFKRFGLGSFIMILCGAVIAYSALAYVTDIGATMAYGSIVNILIGAFKSTDGFTGGYGLIAMIGVPVLVLLLSMGTKKRVPYSIFDN